MTRSFREFGGGKGRGLSFVVGSRPTELFRRRFRSRSAAKYPGGVGCPGAVIPGYRLTIGTPRHVCDWPLERPTLNHYKS